MTDLLPGKYYFIETVTPAGYLAASGEQRFEITADRTDPVTLTVLNQKPAVPKIGKAVSADGENWQENPLELRQPTDIFAYRITVPTALTNGWTGFAITDELDPQLELVNAAGTAYGTEADHDLSAFVTITPELEPDQFALSLDDNNLLTFRYLGNDVAQGVPGTEAVLTFRVRVKDLEAFLKAHPDGKVTNRAAVQTGDQLSGESRDVAVLLPGRIDQLNKTVDGLPEKKLGSREQIVTYNLYFRVPRNQTQLTGLTLKDPLPEDLELVSDGERIAKVYVDNERDDSLRATREDNTVILDLAAARLGELVGKTVRVELQAKLRDGKTVSSVDNTATLYKNGDQAASSASARVLFPVNEPEIKKYAQVTRDNEQLEEAVSLNLAAADESFRYLIEVTLPDNLTDYDSLVIEDRVPEEFTVGEVQIAPASGGLAPDANTGDPNLIRLTLKQSAESDPFADLAGKTLTLAIPVRLKNTEAGQIQDTLEKLVLKYGTNGIPNTASYRLNDGDAVTSNEVTVIPPASAPRLYKTANAYGEDEALTSLGKTTDEFRYNIEFKIPFNVNGIEKIEVTDPINEKLTVLENGVRVFADNVDKTASFNGYLNTENPLTLVLDGTDTETPFDFVAYAGKTIRLEITVKAKPRVLETTDFTEGLVNTAELFFNGTSAGTAAATVKFPLGTVILTKSVEGQPLSRGQTSDFILYDAETRETIILRETQVANNTILGADSKTLTVNDDGRIEINSLDVGKYYFKESKAPVGFELDESEYPFEISVISPQVTLDVDNKALSSEISVSKSWQDAAGNAMYGELPAIPETLTVQLERRVAGTDGDFTPVGDPVTLTAEQGWTYSWAAEPVVNHAGEAYEYRVVETVPENFTPVEPQGEMAAQTTLTDENSFVKTLAFSLTNKYEIPKLATLTATKQWVNGKPEDHGEVTLKLYRTVEGAVPTEADLVNKTPTADNNGQGHWTYTWTVLEQTDAQGRPYTYVVREVKDTGTGEVYAADEMTDKNYVVTYDDATRTVTNTYQAPTLDVIAEKTWQGGPETKPEIELQLYQNDSKYGPTKTLRSDANPAKLTWFDLPKTDDAGRAYRYSIQEVRVGDMAVVELTVDQDGTQTEISKAGEYEVTQPEPRTAGENEDELVFNVTNKYIAGQVNVQAIKFWEGGPAEKPTVTLQLKRNGEDYGDPVQLNNGTTTHTWTVDRADAQGNSYSYAVAEIQIGGQDVSEAPYRVSTETTGLTTTITNTYQSPTQTLQAKKVWVHGEATKPAVYAKLQLLEHGEPVDLTAEKLGLASLPETLVKPQELPADGTPVSWQGVPVNDRNGRPLRYTVSEVNAEGSPWQHERYTSSVAFDAQAKLFTVTNTYASATRTFRATKQWQGGPGDKPAVKIQLFRKLKDDSATGFAPVADKALYLPTDGGGLTAEWSGLPVTDDNGLVYEYVAREIMIGSIEVSGTGSEEDPYQAAGYRVTYADSDTETVITNTYNARVTIAARKVWQGGPEPKPTVYATLQSYNRESGQWTDIADTTKVLTTEGIDWRMNEYDDAGVRIDYRVIETDDQGNADVPEGYRSVVTWNGTRDFTVTNYFAKLANIYIKKVGDDGTAPKDAYFELSGTDIEGNAILRYLRTLGTGLDVFEDVPDGAYVLKETQVPFGYRTDIEGQELAAVSIEDAVVSFTIIDPASAAVDTETTASLIVTNKKLKAALLVHKTDAVTHDPLHGFTVSLTDQLGNELGKYSSGDRTFVALDLYPGNYYIQEISAPAGYHKHAGKIPVMVNEDLEISVNGGPFMSPAPEGNQSFTLTDFPSRIEDPDNPGSPIPTYLAFKLDSETGEGLAEAVFDLKQKETSTQALTVTLDLSALEAEQQTALAAHQEDLTVTLSDDDVSRSQTFDGGAVSFDVPYAGEYLLTLHWTDGSPFASGLIFAWDATDPMAIKLLATSAEDRDSSGRGLEAINGDLRIVNAILENDLALLTEARDSYLTAEAAFAAYDSESDAEATATLTEDGLRKARDQERLVFNNLMQEVENALGETSSTEDPDALLAVRLARLADETAIETFLETLSARRLVLESERDGITANDRNAASASPGELIVTITTEDISENWAVRESGLISSELGVINLGALPDGEYRLEETVAPAGYAGQTVTEFKIANGIVAILGENGYSELGHEEAFVIPNTPRTLLTRTLILTKIWYDIDNQPIEWPNGYSLEFILLRNGVPYSLPQSAGPAGLITAEGTLRIDSAMLVPDGNLLYGLSLTVPEYDPVTGEPAKYTAIEVIHEPSHIDHPYFWFPDNPRVTESGGVIHYDNLDPYKHVEVVVDASFIGDYDISDLPDTVSVTLTGMLRDVNGDPISLDNVPSTFTRQVTLTRENGYSVTLVLPYEVANMLQGPRYEYSAQVEAVPDGFELIREMSNHGSEYDPEKFHKKYVWRFRYVFEKEEFEPPVPPVDPEEPVVPDEPGTPVETKPDVPAIEWEPFIPPIVKRAVDTPTASQKDSMTAPGKVKTPLPATGETRHPGFALISVGLALALLIIEQKRRRH